MSKFYGIFSSRFSQKERSLEISFTALMNPADSAKIIMLEAEDDNKAAEQASSLLKILGVHSHTMLGDPDFATADFPDYFVGVIDFGSAHSFDTASLAYRIHNFTPVKNTR